MYDKFKPGEDIFEMKNGIKAVVIDNQSNDIEEIE